MRTKVKFIGIVAPIGSFVPEILVNVGKKLEEDGKTVTYQDSRVLWGRFTTEYVVITFNLDEKSTIEDFKMKGSMYLYIHSPIWSGRTAKRYVTIMDTNWIAWCIYNKMKKGTEDGSCVAGLQSEKEMLPVYKNELSVMSIPTIGHKYGAVDVSFKNIASLDFSIKIGRATLDDIMEASDRVEEIVGKNDVFIRTISNRIFLHLHEYVLTGR
jgi:hypothetical protein